MIYTIFYFYSASVYEIIQRIKFSSVKMMIPQVVTLIKLYLVCPASTATAERSFSQLRRLKTHLRTTMLQKRMNSLIILATYPELVDELCVKDLVNDFISRNQLIELIIHVRQCWYPYLVVMLCIDKGKLVFLCLLDLSSAFDTVDWNILHCNLSTIGITGAAATWLSSYFIGRSLSVSINQSSSTSHTLKYGSFPRARFWDSYCSSSIYLAFMKSSRSTIYSILFLLMTFNSSSPVPHLT
jgi:hypothetical protein